MDWKANNSEDYREPPSVGTTESGLPTDSSSVKATVLHNEDKRGFVGVMMPGIQGWGDNPGLSGWVEDTRVSQSANRRGHESDIPTRESHSRGCTQDALTPPEAHGATWELHVSYLWPPELQDNELSMLVTAKIRTRHTSEGLQDLDIPSKREHWNYHLERTFGETGR